MRPEQWERVKAVFLKAVECDPAERCAYLEEACQGEPDMRQEVESLLAQQDKGGLFLNGYSSLAGATISHYEILEPLAQGGMGYIYKARDTRLGRQVALKILSPIARLRDRFLEEARFTASLTHPNVVTIYEVDEVEGVAFMAMELIAGRTLNQVIRPKGLSVQKALHYMLQIAEALAAVHEARVVHGDLKPLNIMITGERVKLVDFGLACSPGSSTPVAPAPSEGEGTPRMPRLGTAAYMSPEQLRNEPCDERSDIFALGIILYELLCGRHPFRRGTVEQTGNAILNEEPKGLPRKVPRRLSRIVGRCLAKSPQHRYPSVRALTIALKKASRPSYAWSMAWLPRRVRSSFRGIGLAVVPFRRWALAAMAGIVVAGAALITAQRQWPSSEHAQPQTPATMNRYYQGLALLDRMADNPCFADRKGSCDLTNAIGTLQEAVGDFNEVLKRWPTHGVSYWKRGLAYSDLCELRGQAGEALQAAASCRHAVEDFTAALSHRTSSGEFIQGRLNPANVIWNRAITRITLAELSQKSPKEALPALDIAVSDLKQLLDPNPYARLLQKSPKSVLEYVSRAEDLKRRIISGL